MKTNPKTNSIGDKATITPNGKTPANLACSNNIGNTPPNASPLENRALSECESSISSNCLPLEAVIHFIQLVEEGIDSWVKAGDIICQLVNAHGTKIFGEIQSRAPWMSRNLLMQFYKIGTKEIYPKTLILCSNASVARRLCLLPWGVQKTVCEKGLPVVEDGEVDARIKHVHSLTMKDAAVALTSVGFRSTKDQVELLRFRQNHWSNGRPKPEPKPISPSVERAPVRMETLLTRKEYGHYILQFQNGKLTLIKSLSKAGDSQGVMLKPSGVNLTANITVFGPLTSNF